MPTGGTIIAQASAGGFSPRAIIRVSGPDTAPLLEHTLGSLPTPRRAQPARFTLGPFTLPVLVVFFESPRSYTGEDAAEIVLPGNPHLIDRVMDAMLAVPDVRRANPGEFSARAYLNNKLTIEQAEGIAQLISASNEREREAAQRLMQGHTSSQYRAWADELATLREVDPVVPEGLDDRTADNWRPLLAIAEVVGEEIASAARRTVPRLADPDADLDEEGIMALADLRDAFVEEGAERLPSRVLVERMIANEERPWAGQLNPRRLTGLLRPFGIRPRSLWAEYGGRPKSVKGYFREDCTEAFGRYLGDDGAEVVT